MELDDERHGTGQGESMDALGRDDLAVSGLEGPSGRVLEGEVDRSRSDDDSTPDPWSDDVRSEQPGRNRLVIELAGRANETNVLG